MDSSFNSGGSSMRMPSLHLGGLYESFDYDTFKFQEGSNSFQNDFQMVQTDGEQLHQSDDLSDLIQNVGSFDIDGENVGGFIHNLSGYDTDN